MTIIRTEFPIRKLMGDDYEILDGNSVVIFFTPKGAKIVGPFREERLNIPQTEENIES